MMTPCQLIWLLFALLPAPNHIVLKDGRMVPVKSDYSIRPERVCFQTDRGYLVSLPWSRVDVRATYNPPEKRAPPEAPIYHPVREVPWHLPRFQKLRTVKNGEIVILNEDLKRIRTRRAEAANKTKSADDSAPSPEKSEPNPSDPTSNR